MFLSRLNEMSGGRENMCLVSEALRRILKFLRMTFLISRFCGWQAHFLAFVVKVGNVTAEASQSEKLREWNGIFYVLWMRGRMQQIVMRISRFVVCASTKIVVVDRKF